MNWKGAMARGESGDLPDAGVGALYGDAIVGVTVLTPMMATT